MTLKAAVGIDYEYIGALTLALNDYNKDDSRKQFHQLLTNSTDATVTVTIVYSTIEPAITEQIKDELEYISSKGIDPNDPDWREKWIVSQNAQEGP